MLREKLDAKGAKVNAKGREGKMFLCDLCDVLRVLGVEPFPA